jgi:hypothetical protein
MSESHSSEDDPREECCRCGLVKLLNHDDLCPVCENREAFT